MQEHLDIAEEPLPGEYAPVSGRLECLYFNNTGIKEEWSLTQFNLRTRYDRTRQDWYSKGLAFDTRSPFTTRDDEWFKMELSYIHLTQVLTIKLQGYIFTIPHTHAQATHLKLGTLSISFFKDVEGINPATGDHYTILWTSRLNISVL